MQLAIAAAKDGIQKGDGGPFGCVITRAGQVIAVAHNEVIKNNEEKKLRLALKEKRENDFIAIADTGENFYMSTPQRVTISLISNNSLYKTTTMLNEIYLSNGYMNFIIQNPETLDFQHNREYYRVLASFDCIYTIDSENGIESFNAETHDISAGGVSIITDINIIPTRETSIVIFMPDRELKAYLKFVRCDAFEGKYKLSFTFLDIKPNDYEMLEQFCITKQLNSL